MAQTNESLPAALAPLERLGVGVWRHGLVPMFSVINGIAAPRDRVRESRYGEQRDETMDVIAPKMGVPPRSPVVFVHGGGWISGSKGRFYHRPLLGLADAGHPVFSLNYPLAPESPHPGPLRSLLSALALLRRERDLAGVHLIGDSAGGNLAAMLGLALANPNLL